MKKLFLLIIVCLIGVTMNAQKVYVENFANATIGSNLEGWNGWYKCNKSTDNLGASPKIASGNLFFPGYIGSAIGNVAVLDSVVGTTSATQEISTHWVTFAQGDTLRPIENQRIYAAFLVNFSNHSSRTERDFFTFETSKTSSSTRGRLFAKINTAGTDLTFAVSKNSSTSGVYVETPVMPGAVGYDHLIVLSYVGITGATNDSIYLYVDPNLSLSESQQTRYAATDINTATTDYSVTASFGINLRQRGSGARIGGIRVGTTWNSVLLGTGAIYSGIPQVEKDSNGITAVGKTIITQQSGSLKVFSLSGAEVLSAKTEGRLETSLLKGAYLIRFVGIDGKVQSSKVELK